ncbi:hypothetical protein [Streptomyces sp. NPDC008150]|uniref:hypothetical protein n=1 Tax=Streptomyces sp. NPDC008150 TaxID=3364816 RepID=UPI0036F162A3
MTGREYGAPAAAREWDRLHAVMAPRPSWHYDSDERIGAGRFNDYRAVMPTLAQSRLVVESHGHTVVVDHRGVSIDGRRADPRPPTARESKDVRDPYVSPAFQITKDGTVVSHGRIVARLQHDRPPEVFGPDGPSWARGAGHTVIVDTAGILVDGHRVLTARMLPPRPGSVPLWIAEDGRVFYRGAEIARVDPDKDATETTLPGTPAARPRKRRPAPDPAPAAPGIFPDHREAA